MVVMLPAGNRSGAYGTRKSKGFKKRKPRLSCLGAPLHSPLRSAAGSLWSGAAASPVRNCDDSMGQIGAGVARKVEGRRAVVATPPANSLVRPWSSHEWG